MDAIATTIDVLRKHSPNRIMLPTASAEDLAQITATLDRRHGYRLLRHDEVSTRSLAKINEAVAPLDADVRVMRHIVSQRYSADRIRDRNAHLARDMVDLAVERKNERMVLRMAAVAAATESNRPSSKSKIGQFFGEMVLTAADFDVKTVGIEERDARRAEVDAEIAGMVGWVAKP